MELGIRAVNRKVGESDQEQTGSHGLGKLWKSPQHQVFAICIEQLCPGTMRDAAIHDQLGVTISKMNFSFSHNKYMPTVLRN
jgi:hypothetical protein